MGSWTKWFYPSNGINDTRTGQKNASITGWELAWRAWHEALESYTPLRWRSKIHWRLVWCSWDCLDETSCKKGHEYITLVADIKDPKVIFACERKNSSTVTSFSEDLQNHNGNPRNIKSVCSDMSPSYISGISKEFSQAKITFDKFHVWKRWMKESMSKNTRAKKIRNSKIPNLYGLQTRKI